MTKTLRYLLFVGCFGFLIAASSCQQEQKVDIESQLILQLFEDFEFKQLCETVKDERQKAMIDYYSIYKRNNAYLYKNIDKIEKGSIETKIEVYKNSGMTNVEDYVNMRAKRDNTMQSLKKKYEKYKNSLGDAEFRHLFVNLLVKNSKPIVDSLHLIQAFPSTK